MIARMLAAVAALVLLVQPAAAQVVGTTPVATGGGSLPGTPARPAWVFGASPLRTAGANGLFAPEAARLTEVADIYLPAQPAGWRVVFTNFGLSNVNMAPGSPRELMPGNPNTIDFAATFTGANGTSTRVALTFGGATSATMVDGGFAISDPLPAFAGGWLRYSLTTPAGGQRAKGFTSSSGGVTGEQRRNLSAPNASLAAGGSIAAAGLPANTSNGYLPAAVLVPWSRQSSVLLIGDSITQQDDDNRLFASSRGVVGGIARGLDDTAVTGSFGVGSFGHHGAQMIDLMDTSDGSRKFAQRYALLAYIYGQLNGGQVWPFSAIWSQGLRNDFTNLAPAPANDAEALAAMKARASDWWAWLAATFPGIPIVQSTVTPRTASPTEFWTSLSAQTTNPLASGTALQAFNDWVMTRPAPLALAVDLRGTMQVLDAGVPKWPLTAFALAGGGTLMTPVAAGTSLSSVGVRVTATSAPIVGTYLVLEPGSPGGERSTTMIVSAAANGDGSYTVKTSGGSTASAHAAGVAVLTTNTTDGTHPSSALQQASADAVAANKPQVAGLR